MNVGESKGTPLAIDGERQSGMNVRTENVTAAVAVANIIRSSYGPVGLDKMLVDDIGDVTISNDGATILKLLEVEHPAAKVLVELADLQDKEVGDGTTTVVLLAAELLRKANSLVGSNIHPTTVLSGYRIACREACKYINDVLSFKVADLGEEALINAAKTSIASKLIGGEEADFFSKLAIDAIKRVKVVNHKGEDKYPVKSVNILKSSGKSAKDSIFVEGYALNCTVASQQMPHKITGAKIAFLDFDLNKAKMMLGAKIVLDDPDNLVGIKEREADIIKEKIKLILESGANVVFTTKGIDDLCIKYFVEAGAMAVRRCKKEDLKRICKATGGNILLNLANLEGGESFDPENLGEAEEVVQEKLADEELILIKGTKFEKSASIILRGANYFMLEEMERSLHDALCVVKRVLESGKVVPGAGAVEAALSVYLDTFARTIGSREQAAVAEFSEALLSIPKTLAVNAAQDATELVSVLRAHHFAAQTDDKKKDYKSHGLDLENGVVADSLTLGVLEPAMSKIKSIKFATEAAITILRIDDVIQLNPQVQPEGGHGHGH